MQRPSDEALGAVFSRIGFLHEGHEGLLTVSVGFEGFTYQGAWAEALQDLYDKIKAVVDEIEAVDEKLRHQRAWQGVSS